MLCLSSEEKKLHEQLLTQRILLLFEVLLLILVKIIWTWGLNKL